MRHLLLEIICERGHMALFTHTTDIVVSTAAKVAHSGVPGHKVPNLLDFLFIIHHD